MDNIQTVVTPPHAPCPGPVPRTPALLLDATIAREAENPQTAALAHEVAQVAAIAFEGHVFTVEETL